MKFRRSINVKVSKPHKEEIPMVVGISDNSILLSMYELKIRKDHKP